VTKPKESIEIREDVNDSGKRCCSSLKIEGNCTIKHVTGSRGSRSEGEKEREGTD